MDCILSLPSSFLHINFSLHSSGKNRGTNVLAIIKRNAKVDTDEPGGKALLLLQMHRNAGCARWLCLFQRQALLLKSFAVIFLAVVSDAWSSDFGLPCP